MTTIRMLTPNLSGQHTTHWHNITAGPHDVACLNQDDEAKVPLIGLPAANKQSTFVIIMGFEVTVPDHNFVFVLWAS